VCAAEPWHLREQAIILIATKESTTVVMVITIITICPRFFRLLTLMVMVEPVPMIRPAMKAVNPRPSQPPSFGIP
jgi:ABC-type uncharacterized transport system permease subunit